MISLRDALKVHCDCLGGPLSPSGTQSGDLDLLLDYQDILLTANGFVTHHGFFRFFGQVAGCGLTSRGEHDQSPWKHEYGTQISIVAEDVFGDQYGILGEVRGRGKVFKLYCEGGTEQQLEYADLHSFLMESVLIERPTAFDFQLANAALEQGLKANRDEHFAFVLPLICGGKNEVANLGVESAALHLGLLSQISRQSAHVADGTQIARFFESA